MGDSLSISLSDIIPSFAPSPSSPSSSPSINLDLLPEAPTAASQPSSPTTTTNREPLGGGPTTSTNNRTTTPPPPPPPPSNNQTIRPRNGTLTQPKPGALVGTNGGGGNTAKSPNTVNVDGASSAPASSNTPPPVGAILGGVLAGVIMITLAVTLLVALRKKRSASSRRLDPPMMRGAPGRMILMEKGQMEDEEDVWNVKPAPQPQQDYAAAPPQLPPLKLDWTVDETPIRVQEPSPQDAYHYDYPPHLHGAAARPDSVGSIVDAPMNYVVALEERVPRSNLRVMNRVSNASVDE